MTEFAHTNREIAIIDVDADYTLVRYRKNGRYDIVDSNDLAYLKDENMAVMAAMNAVSDYDEHCDVIHFGEHLGTAEYVDMTPSSFFSSMQVVYSTPC